MITQNDRDFVNDLFGKLINNVDVDMLDLHDSDSCDDHLIFEQLSFFDVTVTEVAQGV